MTMMRADLWCDPFFNCFLASGTEPGREVDLARYQPRGATHSRLLGGREKSPLDACWEGGTISRSLGGSDEWPLAGRERRKAARLEGVTNSRSLGEKKHNN